MEVMSLLAGSVFFPFVYHFTKFIMDKYFSRRLSVGDIRLISER